jgi:hypothetical protein
MRVTERLRELFEAMVLDEPPLRTTPQATADAGRRRLRRGRTVWAVAGAALVVAVVAALPQAGLTSTAGPSAHGPTADASTGPTSAPTLALQSFRVCPGNAAQSSGPEDVLPDPAVAMAALLAAGSRVAPDRTFVAGEASLSHVKLGGVAHVEITVDVADGSLIFSIYPDAEPVAERTASGTNISACVDGSSHDFPDGSVALFYPIGHEDTVMHIWYYAASGFTMNIGMFPNASGNMPLSIEQVMLLADAIAQAA